MCTAPRTRAQHRPIQRSCRRHGRSESSRGSPVDGVWGRYFLMLYEHGRTRCNGYIFYEYCKFPCFAIYPVQCRTREAAGIGHLITQYGVLLADSRRECMDISLYIYLSRLAYKRQWRCENLLPQSLVVCDSLLCLEDPLAARHLCA
jgi:hypothetical protein